MRYYELSADNTIIGVDDDWDELIITEKSEGKINANVIIGRPISDFIAGDLTQTVMEAAFQYVRYRQETLVKQYRCDDAFYKRHYDMIITPIDNLGLRVSHKLIKQEARNSKVRRGEDKLYAMTSCSICRKFWWQDNWLEVEDLSILLHLSIEALHKTKQFTVCESCQQQYKPAEVSCCSLEDNAYITLGDNNPVATISGIGNGLAKK